jgi:diaminopimelate decarboxylase
MGDTALVRRFGSPLYVYELDRIAEAVDELRSTLPEPAALHYSLKANPHPDLVQQARLRGCLAEVSSEGELTAALIAGFAGRECLYTGPAKSPGELTAAVAAGVSLFSVESAADLRRTAAVAAAAGRTVECLIRISAPPSGATALRMTGAATQFGVDVAEVLADPTRFRDPDGARVVGAHFFPLSNARDEHGLAAELVASIAWAARLRDGAGLRMSYVDLGGGFAAPYAQPGVAPPYPGLRRTLESSLDTHLTGWRDGRPVVAFESGRRLVGAAGRLVCTVVEVKSRAGRTFVVLDSGINHLGGLSGIGRMLPAAAPEPVARRAGATADPVEATITGPLCTPADVLARAVRMVRPEPGDLVAFPNVGAYGMTASLTGFLSRPAPVEVVLRGGVVLSASRLNHRREPVRAALRHAERRWHVPEIRALADGAAGC